MTIKELRDILVHFEDKKYDDFKVILWDYEHQRELDWGGCHGFSKPENSLCFPVNVPPEDGISIFEKLKQLQNVQKENK